MHLVNDSPSFTPVHSQIRAIGPQNLYFAKGRGRGREMVSAVFGLDVISCSLIRLGNPFAPAIMAT